MAAYEDSVFLNVPFDNKYSRLSDALVFAVYDRGFVARSALEVEDSGKVLDIIEQSKFGLRDISRAGLDDLGLAFIAALALRARSAPQSTVGTLRHD
jgi:hypothetical protein